MHLKYAFNLPGNITGKKEEHEYMQAITGIGKLYDGEGKRVIGIISHKVWEKLEGGNNRGEWGGDFLIDRVIWPSGEHIIELENGQRGSCVIDIEQEVNGCPVNYRYTVKGNGSLSRPKE